jgi:uncharacterized protein YceH (UPF0502 family)
MTLDPVQVRVLGALMEKEITTPETYPLSLNALIAACNQRSSRDPVMELTEEQVRQALHRLEDLGLTAVVRDSRVAKYEHRIRTVLNLRRDETAVLCLLFLRGPQTPGELRSRSDRLFSFDGLDMVESTLERMMTRPAAPAEEESARAATSGPQRSESLSFGPLVAVLPRQPGSREARYAHLLGGPLAAGSYESGGGRVSAADRAHNQHAVNPSESNEMGARLTVLEAEVAALRSAVAAIEERLTPATDSRDLESMS